MSWDAVGAIADATGALAVIVSILNLAIQVRQGSADLRTNIIHSLHSAEVDLASKPAVDTVLATAIEKDHTDQELSAEAGAQSIFFAKRQVFQ